ncbi:SMP-30/gluconolactonase/LRE family protein [Phytoactinopolyspora endophytica]|uniref:SMP-30/gluconolactonase/LRE family protein n=1 Tax=Phytoactinopolyspora endophytica TaxID=1642495 RepID=UPI00101DBB69|nr:SMP-30/gluconolactonase/LRE family protein [Phytoactinopolyspora endophytica]
MRAEAIDEADGPRTHLGESPRWDGEAWWWVDAAVGEVWTRRGGERAKLVWRTGRRTSMVHPEASGGAVVACEQQLHVLRHRDGGGYENAGVWCDLDLGDGWLLNDGVADARGRLWIGTVAPERRPLGGSLWRVEPNGEAYQAARDFTMSNGMAWDTTGTRLFHVDSAERTIWEHWIDVDKGEVFGREIFVRLDDDDGLPDGIAADEDGGLWVAVYGTGQVRRYSGSGKLDLVVEVDPPQCTSVEIGGSDGCDVLITTAREGYDDARSAAEPWAGRLYRLRTFRAGLVRSKVVVEKEEGQARG